MAEYSEVIKQFKRMCQYYNGNKDECPQYCKEHACNISHCRMLAFDDKKFHNMVMVWAAEHPEPVYPTWMEWLTNVGAIPKAISWDEPLIKVVYYAIQEHIPADIAKKLGIKPKEGRNG